MENDPQGYQLISFFQVKLCDIESLDLLDKRGYLTICLHLVKDGKIYLRRPEGIKDWYNILQVSYKQIRWTV